MLFLSGIRPKLSYIYGMKYVFLLAIVWLLISCNSSPESKYPVVKINSSEGDIFIEVYTDKAPVTSAAFLKFIQEGYYRNSSFYRALLQEGVSASQNRGVLQGGIHGTNDRTYPNVPGIRHESTKTSGLTHQTGTVSLARNEPGSGNTEFFICIGDQPQYDAGQDGVADMQGYAAFGKVIEGMPVVRKIQQLPCNGDQLMKPVAIREITLIKN